MKSVSIDLTVAVSNSKYCDFNELMCLIKVTHKVCNYSTLKDISLKADQIVQLILNVVLCVYLKKCRGGDKAGFFQVKHLHHQSKVWVSHSREKGRYVQTFD